MRSSNAVALDRTVEIFILGILLVTGASEEAIKSVTAGSSNDRLVLANHSIIFLIDQMNALEMDPSGIDGLNDAAKGTTYMWIRECVAPHKYIFSASAIGS